MLDKLQEFLQSHLGPLATRLNKSILIQSLTADNMALAEEQGMKDAEVSE